MIQQQLREAAERRRAEHDIHKGIVLPHILRGLLLRCHAAAEHEDQVGIAYLFMLDVAEDAVHMILRTLPHSAGIQQDQVCLLPFFRERKSDLPQHATDALAVRDVELTSKAVHIRTNLLPSGKQVRPKLRQQRFRQRLCQHGILYLHPVLSSFLPENYRIFLFRRTKNCRPGKDITFFIIP